MNLGLVFKRSRREWRQLAILAFALCLVTAFFSLGPMYVRAAVQSGLQFALNAINQSDMALTLNNPQPWQPESWTVINEQIGDLGGNLTRVSRNAAAFSGFSYSFGETLYELSGRSQFNYFVYAFSNLRDKVKIIDGRWPQRLAAPNDPQRRASNEEDAYDKGLGIYSRGEVEAVISPTVARIAGLEVGSRFVVGTRAENAAVVHVVGIVDAIDVGDPFWRRNTVRQALTGVLTDVGLKMGNLGFGESFDVSFIVTEGAFSDWIAAAARFPNNDNVLYTWDVALNSKAVTADNVTDVQQRMTYLGGKLQADYGGLQVINPMLAQINNYADLVSKTEGPIIWVSGAVLIMMLYHLVTTVNLVLEQQVGEWASLSSRGASTRQLLSMQASTMLVLAGIGSVVGPFIAYVILSLLTRYGPLSLATAGTLPIQDIPRNAFILSLIAAGVALLFLTLPAIPAARRSLAQFKQLVARPPERPFWARYYLDVVLILLGIGFIGRLFFFIEGDLQQTLALLVNNPSLLLRNILDSATRSGGLSDPMNLAGPALLLTGVALLWLRLFPLLMKFIGYLMRQINTLTAPLAVWNVERDPGHYAQLVLLLIGTLALGTTALALSATREQGSWQAAKQQVGGAVVVELINQPDNSFTDTPAPTWTQLPDVSGATSVVHIATVQKAGAKQIHMLGVDPQQLGQVFPDLRDSVNPLLDAPMPTLLGGAILAEGTQRLLIDIYVPDQPLDNVEAVPTGFYVWIYLRDQLGGTQRIQMQAENWQAGQWNTYQADLSTMVGRPPYLIAGLEFAPFAAQTSVIRAGVLLDNLRSENTNGQVTLISSFDRDGPQLDLDFRDQLQAHSGQGITNGNFETKNFTQGRGSLGLTYVASRLRNDPGPDVPDAERAAAEAQIFASIKLVSRSINTLTVPVILNERFAKDLGEANTRERLPFKIGDKGLFKLSIAGGEASFNYEIVGVVPNFPSLDRNDYTIIMNRLLALQLFNLNTASVYRLYGPNQMWLNTQQIQPAANLPVAIQQIPNTGTVQLAWDQYNVLLREPLPAALAGMLFAGFWISLVLSLLGFAFYLVVTAKRRSLSFAVLRALGWNANRIWLLLLVEQTAMVVPAVIVGILIGLILAFIILPFLALIGGQTLLVPFNSILSLVLILILGFGLLSFGAAYWLRRLNINQVLRLGEE